MVSTMFFPPIPYICLYCLPNSSEHTREMRKIRRSSEKAQKRIWKYGYLESDSKELDIFHCKFIIGRLESENVELSIE